MKTQEFKNSELVKTSKLMILISMIIFCEILLLSSGSGESNKSSEELMGLNFLPSIQHITFANSAIQELEKEKLILKMKFTEEAIRNENEMTNNATPRAEFSMATMSEYLIAENETELDVSITNSIVFQEAEPADLTAENELNNARFLENLKRQAYEKTKEAVEFYALERKVKEYLTIEIEKPLELEEWMISKKCWCPELRETTAMAEKK